MFDFFIQSPAPITIPLQLPEFDLASVASKLFGQFRPILLAGAGFLMSIWCINLMLLAFKNMVMRPADSRFDDYPQAAYGHDAENDYVYRTHRVHYDRDHYGYRQLEGASTTNYDAGSYSYTAMRPRYRKRYSENRRYARRNSGRYRRRPSYY